MYYMYESHFTCFCQVYVYYDSLGSFEDDSE